MTKTKHIMKLLTVILIVFLFALEPACAQDIWKMEVLQGISFRSGAWKGIQDKGHLQVLKKMACLSSRSPLNMRM